MEPNANQCVTQQLALCVKFSIASITSPILIFNMGDGGAYPLFVHTEEPNANQCVTQRLALCVKFSIASITSPILISNMGDRGACPLFVHTALFMLLEYL